MTKLLSRLSKSEILSLPGFDRYGSLKIKELKPILKKSIKQMNIAFRGVRVSDYVNRFNEIREQKQSDDDLFKRMSTMKHQQQKQHQSHEQYKQSLKDTAMFERSLMNMSELYSVPKPSESKLFIESLMNVDTEYTTTKSDERLRYEENVHDKDEYQNEMKRMMLAAKNHESFEIDIDDDSEKQYAFVKVLRYIRKMKTNEWRPIITGYDMNGNGRKFSINKELDLETMIRCILGEITVEDYSSDCDPNLIGWDYIPVRFEVKFIKMTKNEETGKTEFIEKVDGEEVVIESVDDFRGSPDGGFFPYINLINGLDLTRYQIFNTINKNNYRDNCFVYACVQSGVFNDDELHKLRSIMLTRSIPNKKITEIAIQMKCHFVISRVDDKRDSRHQKRDSVDTRKNPKVIADRVVRMLLYKDHFMIDHNELLPITKFYIEHKDEIDMLYPDMNIQQRFIIYDITNKGTPMIEPDDWTGTEFKTIIKSMFEHGCFREINQCEQGILDTCEFDNHLNDYVSLSYDEESCCRLESADTKKITEWSHIYYADYETDVTVSPHRPYLICLCDTKHVVPFTGSNITSRFLNSLKSNSSTYFHNLKYDGCFFIHEPDWETQITQRSGTLLQVVMDQYKWIQVIDPKTKKPVIDPKTNEPKMKKIRSKHLTFRNSYSIIPAPLRDFDDMFNLKVHKEIIAYRIYTEKNLQRKTIPFDEFYDQYVNENIDKKTVDELEQDRKQLISNAKFAKSYDEADETIDIMKYATFYCIKDCVTLMDGMTKFNNDLAEVFTKTDKPWIGIHQFISISAVGYDFARIYGCFDGCYLLSGKPQNFIQRCVSGGRTMTANNEKQYIVDRIQDFDAVSLYPSSMSIMDGVAKGKPKVIPDDCTHEQLMNYDTFFIEVNINKLSCKSNRPYKFGHVFTCNEAGSKIFCNETVDHYYVDKITLMDLIEFYDIDYELIRGYYFDEGFNKKINEFIKTLFDLRLKYKNEHNPLEKTIKLLLNSIYGKSILKPMNDEIKVVNKKNLISYIYRNYNFIKEVSFNDSTKCFVKKIKPINNHFNLPQFGASVLSWSKHIMNQVMSTAEQHGIDIYYQDTDSLHLKECDVDRLAEIYKVKYGRDLIGKQMTQFHCDFDSFPGAVGNIHSRKLIALGKKSYLDILEDETGNTGYHIRLKGCPKQCILNKCKRMNITVEELYERLYNGESITFDLTDGCNCFRKTKCFQQITLPQFLRKVQFK